MNTLTALSDAEIRQLAKQNAAEGKLLNPMMDIVFKTLFITVIAWGVSRIIKRTMAEYIAAGNFGGNKETEALAVLRKLTGALVWIIAGVFIPACYGIS